MDVRLILQIGFLAAFIAALLVAAVSDALTQAIPNELVLGIAVAFPIAAFLAFKDVAWVSHIAAAGIVLGLGAALFKLGAFGGGDVKLWAAAALWTGLEPLYYQAVCITLIGGAMGVCVLLIRAVLAKWGASLGIPSERLPLILRPKGAIPYGIAIAGGAILSIPKIAEFDTVQVVLRWI